MTNEEKAEELAKGFGIDYYAKGSRHPIDHSFDECYKSALEMAEWKDQQFKEYLEKKRFDADKEMEEAYESGDQWDYYISEQNQQLFTEIINELFKEDRK